MRRINQSSTLCIPLKNQPIYLLDPKNPVVEEHRFAIEAAVIATPPKLAMHFAPEVITLRDASLPQEIIFALQHYPQHIEAMLGTLHFDFEVTEGSELFLPEADWKMKPKYVAWFHAMSALKVMPFFVKDQDVRLYMLAGDYLVKAKMPVVKEARSDGRFKYILKGGNMPELCKRLAESCRQFMLYCHNTGFDPKDTIISMLADYSLPVHYIDIYNEYRKEVKHSVSSFDAAQPAYRFKAA